MSDEDYAKICEAISLLRKDTEDNEYLPDRKFSKQDLMDIRAMVLPTEETQRLIEVLDNALRHKEEADYWVQQAQNWVAVD